MFQFPARALPTAPKTMRMLLGGVACAGALAMVMVSFAEPAQAQTRAQTSAQPGATAARSATATPSAPPQQPDLPSDGVLLILIRSTLSALAQANLTNNYSVLHALGSVNFQRTTSVEQLQKNFAPLRANGINLLPLVLLTPQLVTRPAVQNGRLRLTGFYPTQPARASFDLLFEPSQGQWRMQGINVTLSPAPAPAPAPALTPGKAPPGGTGKPGAPANGPRPSR